MNKKLIAAFIAVFLLLSCAASAFAVAGVGIGDIIGVISSIDASEYTKYNEQEWTTLTPAERAEQLNYVINHQKGTSHLNESSDLINNSAASFQAYDILTGNSSVGGALLGGYTSSNMIMKIGLEQKGYADFGMGYYNSNGHSSGKFGDGTVADTLNDEFLDYLQSNELPKPYGSRFTSGDYTFEYGFKYYPFLEENSGGTSEVWKSFVYCDVYYKGSLDNSMVSMSSIRPNIDYSNTHISKPPSSLLEDIERVPPSLYYDEVRKCIYTSLPEKSWLNPLFNLSQYIQDDITYVSDDIPVIGVDDNGNTIDLNINSDGVTYEGNTYNYNDDNSVTINGNTYHITVNPADVNEDYYNQFLQQVINNYYNYYGTDAMPFDSTDIIKSLQSIFNSLEKFRSDCYLHLKQISNYVVDGFNSMRSSLNSVIKRLDEIIKQLKGLGGMSDMTDEEYANYQKKLEAAVNARFLPVIELKDLVEKALEAYKNNSMSQINFDYNGRSYSIDFSTWFTSENLQAIRFLMAAFIYVSYAFNTFRRIPSYINNGGDK